MRAPLTVLTATIPGRQELLAEALTSVYAQTLPPELHLVSAQSPGVLVAPVHLAMQRNRLWLAAQTPWVASLDDDDLWLPEHLEVIAPALEGADVVYSFDADGHLPCENCNGWSQERLMERFDAGNFIAAGAAVRSSVLADVGGWPIDWQGPSQHGGGHFAGSHANFEDWELWRRLCRAGARFRCVPERTWRYRPGTWPRMSTGEVL